MTTLVVGASGATGTHLVNQLLSAGNRVKVIVRSTANTPSSWEENPAVVIIKNSVLEISTEEMANLLQDCDAVASCLGHNLTFKGMFGKPRRLVTDAVKLLCDAIHLNAPSKPIKFVLMNTTGNRNRDLREPISLSQKIVVGILRVLLPPHVDNEQAAEYLRTQIGQKNKFIEWAAVRPDGLINEEAVSEYEIYPSPIRSAIFDAGTVSRINVGDFMAQLISISDMWENWKGQMPVIYSLEKK
ncbi:MAG: NAD(P)-dependent oxidoreductase [Bacteroidia bacterium]